MIDIEESSRSAPPYYLPHMPHEYLRKEIKALLELGISAHSEEGQK